MNVHIEVTCAAGGMSEASESSQEKLSDRMDYDTMYKALEEAAHESYYSGTPVKLVLN